MTCPNGHKADKERGECGEVAYWCVICGWRTVLKIKKNARKRWIEKRRRQQKLYAMTRIPKPDDL
jgi:hypothetical protein